MLFVALVQLVCNASLDDNAFWLAENANKFMVENAVTKSYFEGQNYEMHGGVVTPLGRDIRDAMFVRDHLLNTTTL